MENISSWKSIMSSSTAFLIDWYFLAKVAMALKAPNYQFKFKHLLLLGSFSLFVDLILIIGVIAVEGLSHAFFQIGLF